MPLQAVTQCGVCQWDCHRQSRACVAHRGSPRGAGTVAHPRHANRQAGTATSAMPSPQSPWEQCGSAWGFRHCTQLTPREQSAVPSVGPSVQGHSEGQGKGHFSCSRPSSPWPRWALEAGDGPQLATMTTLGRHFLPHPLCQWHAAPWAAEVLPAVSSRAAMSQWFYAAQQDLPIPGRTDDCCGCSVHVGDLTALGLVRARWAVGGRWQSLEGTLQGPCWSCDRLLCEAPSWADPWQPQGSMWCEPAPVRAISL